MVEDTVKPEQKKSERVRRGAFWVTFCVIAGMLFWAADTTIKLVESRASIALLQGKIVEMNSNMLILQQAMTEAQEKQVQAENMLKPTQEELASVKSELETVKAELQPVKDGLVATKDNLKAAQEALSSKDAWIDKLEQSISQSKLEELKKE